METPTSDLANALAAAGHRLTGPRRAVWKVVSTASGHVTADEIATQVREVDPSVNRSSVYRSLALFEELGLMRQSSLGPTDAAHWEMAHPDEQFHMRCEICGNVEHHTGDLVQQVTDHLAGDHGFQVNHVDLVVTGICADCQSLEFG
ncbi:MAG: Fur family transcriptional regulator [Actinomycetota bacterium]